uniref:Putative acetyltransferase n=1 Tax=Trypanosoma congolense (strain IL3000) TaxID=1068625 RepID=G0UJ65_TRYCI|nr:putative acetyltransferase [Trypanosoma congolense IL3000]
MSTSCRVRAAVPGDIEVMIEMQKALAMETEGLQLDEAAVRRGITAPFERENIARFYVAEEVPDSSDGAGDAAGSRPPKIVGAMTVTYEWSDWRGCHILWIQSVYIIPSWRRRGVFRKFFDHVHRLVMEDPAFAGMRLCVARNNENAINTYKRMGMTVENYHMMKLMKGKY